jgi:hypothetical protein
VKRGRNPEHSLVAGEAREREDGEHGREASVGGAAKKKEQRREHSRPQGIVRVLGPCWWRDDDLHNGFLRRLRWLIRWGRVREGPLVRDEHATTASSV